MGRLRHVPGLAILLVASLILSACGDDDAAVPSATAPANPTLSPQPTEPPTPTSETVSPEPSPTATSVPGLPAAFRDFVHDEVAPALAAGDVGFFADHAVTEHIACTEEDLQALGAGGPDCGSVGQEFDGFALGFFQSEVNVEPLQDAIALIQRLFTEEASSATDEFGGSRAQVYALGVPNAAWVVEGGYTALVSEQSYGTVLTAIIERPKELSAAGAFTDPLRVALILNWTREGDGFRLVSLLGALTTGDGFLAAGESFWPAWELYQP